MIIVGSTIVVQKTAVTAGNAQALNPSQAWGFDVIL